jgi:hypothetical protein
LLGRPEIDPNAVLSACVQLKSIQSLTLYVRGLACEDLQRFHLLRPEVRMFFGNKALNRCLIAAVEASPDIGE